MSDNAGFLSWASSTISSESAAIQEKIDRLEKAKGDIIEEQATCMNEIKRIVEPTLIPLWDGAKEQEYDEIREEVYDIMEAIYTDEYDAKISQIESKISSLQAQLAALSATSSLVSAASDLLDKGEEFVQELNDTISDIRGRLPWV